MDIVAATAAESKSLADAESMKMAARKISIRIITFYVMAVFTASFVVPYNHPFINGGGSSVGSHSPFIIAPVEAGIPSAAHFINGMFVLSSFTCAIDSLYVASRVLHTLALRNQTGTEFITRRLRQCRSGVPVRAVLASGIMMLIAYMGRTGSPGEVGRIDTKLSEVKSSVLTSDAETFGTDEQCHGFVPDNLCYHLRNLPLFLPSVCIFLQTLLWDSSNSVCRLQDIQTCNTSIAQAGIYDRSNPRYPYKSHAQWIKAAYGFVGCIILVLFNGVNAFLLDPFNVRLFIASYIGVSLSTLPF